jgi:uncharacterized protein (TIGR00162 family)
MSVEIKMLKEFTPNQFVLVCGLPGTAYIGKLSVDYLIQQLKAELVGEIYSKYFPPFVVIKEDGLVELLRNELHQFKDESGRTIVFLTGNSQAFSPDGQYEVADAVLNWAINNGVHRIYSIAAYLTDRTFEVPNVYCTTTSLALLEEAKANGAQLLDHGVIGGENGIITGLAKKKNVEGACLLAETHGYQTPTGEYVIDPRAAKAALKVLTSMLNLKVDMEPMEKQVVQMDEAVAKLVEIERRIREEMASSGKRPAYVT